jgi:hypothetical protein
MTSHFTTVSETITFVAADDSWSEDAGSDVSVLGFPGGDDIAISIAGQRETRRSFKAVLDSVEDYRTFKTMRARAGWLLVENWDAVEVRAVLVSVKPDPIWISGEVTATAQFILY